jgi:Flp pilus assembly pilin Flp
VQTGGCLFSNRRLLRSAKTAARGEARELLIAATVRLLTRSSTPRFARPSGRSLGRDTRGAAYLEYLVVYAAVGLVVAAGLVAIGPSVVRHYSAQRQVLYQSSP